MLLSISSRKDFISLNFLFLLGELFENGLFISIIPSQNCIIVEKRKIFKYDGPAILILDGCSCHYTPTLYRLCNEHKITIFFLQPYSSNQTQPLDMVVFHLHKEQIRKYINLENDDSLLAEKLKNLIKKIFKK